jgi:hypothetical protein
MSRVVLPERLDINEYERNGDQKNLDVYIENVEYLERIWKELEAEISVLKIKEGAEKELKEKESRQDSASDPYQKFRHRISKILVKYGLSTN